MTTADRRLADYLTPLMPRDTGLEPSGRLGEKPAAFLFDVYGTLLISAAGDLAAAGSTPPYRPLAHLLDQYAVRRDPQDLCLALRQEIASAHQGLREKGVDYPEIEIDRIWQTVLGTADRDLARQFALEFEMTVNPVYPMPDAAAVLAAIRKTNRAAGIISNAQFYTGHLFKLFFGDFPQNAWADPDLVFYSFEHGHAKPSPYLFDLAAAALKKKGIAPGRALYVGNDMAKDIRPAAMAGFKTALFAGDARSLRMSAGDPGRPEIRPDIVITALHQLEQYI